MNRRSFVAGVGSLAMVAGGVACWPPMSSPARAAPFEITRSEAQWRAMLGESRYPVLREGVTERPFTSPLLAEDCDGTYHCAGCDVTLYASATKTELP